MSKEKYFMTWKLYEFQISVPTNKVYLTYNTAIPIRLWLLNAYEA